MHRSGFHCSRIINVKPYQPDPSDSLTHEYIRCVMEANTIREDEIGVRERLQGRPDLDEAAHFEIVEQPPASLDWFGNELVSEHMIPGTTRMIMTRSSTPQEFRQDPDDEI